MFFSSINSPEFIYTMCDPTFVRTYSSEADASCPQIEQDSYYTFNPTNSSLIGFTPILIFEFEKNIRLKVSDQQHRCSKA